MGLTLPAAQLVSLSRAKFWKVVVKCEIVMFFNFWVFLTMFIFEVVTCLSNQLNFFSGSVYLKD